MTGRRAGDRTRTGEVLLGKRAVVRTLNRDVL